MSETAERLGEEEPEDVARRRVLQRHRAQRSTRHKVVPPGLPLCRSNGKLLWEFRLGQIRRRDGELGRGAGANPSSNMRFLLVSPQRLYCRCGV